MISIFALAVIGCVQIAFIVAMLVLLRTAHHHAQHDDRREVAARERLSGSVRALVMGEDHGESLIRALGQLDRVVAIRHVLEIAATQLAPEQLRDFAARLRPVRWVDRTIASGTSKRWWKRMEAARLLRVVTTPADLPLLAQLVCDEHPAVASAATGAIAGRVGPDFVETIILGLSKQPPAIRLQQMRALRSHAAIASPMVVAQLEVGGSAVHVGALVELAERLGTPDALAAVVPYASHLDGDVRVTVARALRSCFMPAGVEAARRLLNDTDWRVRAAAARALGGLNAVSAVPDLRAALRDDSWWVRFRAAIALGLLGEPGAFALASAAASEDEFARDIAVVVRGLSVPALLELNT